MTVSLTPAQVFELVLVGAGALAHLHVVAARSASTRVVWFNSGLYAWMLSWSIWYASVFTSLNLETIAYGRFPGISMALDLLKGVLLNVQCAFLLHGLSRWTGSGRWVPAWAWYLVPTTFVAIGAVNVVSHPMLGFLANVEPLTRQFLVVDIATCLLGIRMLRGGMKRFDGPQRSVARPLIWALAALSSLLAAALCVKISFGSRGPGLYDWVLLHEGAHLLPPSALLWAAYRTESVALEVTRSSLARARAFGALILAYLGAKFAFPLSEFDRAATWGMAGLGFWGTLGPVSFSVGRALSRWWNRGLAMECRRLSRLESRLWKPVLAEDAVLDLAARGIGAVLRCRSLVLPADDRRVGLVLACRGAVGCADPTAPIAMSSATSRAEIPAWEELSARVLLPVRTPDGVVAIALGATPKADRLPDAVLERLGAIQSTCRRVLESRRGLRERLEAQRVLQESERLAMLGLLAASAAHEIGNPLSAIRNIACAARSDAPTDSVLHRDLSVVVGEVERLDATVRRMLHFARDRGECEDAPATVGAVVGLLSVEARGRSVGLRVEGGGSSFPLPMPENDLKAILFNLLLNAIRHAPEGSDVEVVLDRSGPSLEVGNLGEIPVDFRPRLFQPLFSRGGNGLGLYVSRSKAIEAGGRLEYRPGPGRTSFRLTWEDP
jgi:signal transduction histidine kinase